eukprot:11968-Heterococcus_DN1.PRE.1
MACFYSANRSVPHLCNGCLASHLSCCIMMLLYMHVHFNILQLQRQAQQQQQQQQAVKGYQMLGVQGQQQQLTAVVRGRGRGMTLPAWLTERRQSEAAAATATAATALTEGAPNTGTGAGNSGAERSGSELSAKPLVALEKACIKESGVLSAGLGYVIDGFYASDTADASSDEYRCYGSYASAEAVHRSAKRYVLTQSAVTDVTTVLLCVSFASTWLLARSQEGGVSQASKVQGGEVGEALKSGVGKDQEVEVSSVEGGRTGTRTDQSNKDSTATAAASDAAVTTTVTGANKVSTYIVDLHVSCSKLVAIRSCTLQLMQVASVH